MSRKLHFLEQVAARLGINLSGLLGGSFRKNVLKIAGGTVIGQALFFLASPVLTRLYTPSDFGRFSVYAAILSIVLIAVSLRYEIAIPIARDSGEAFSLAVLSTIALVLFSIGAGILAFCLYNPLQAIVSRNEALVYCYLFPLSILGGGAYKVLNFYAIRAQAYGTIARTRITQCVGQVLVQLLGGLMQYGLAGLVLGDALGRMMGVRYLLRKIRELFPPHPWTGRVKSMREAALRYWSYPLLSTPSAVINMIAFQLPTVLLTFWYGPATAGLFSLSQTILGAPVTLISQAVAQVFTGEIAKQGLNAAVLLPLYRSTAKRLLLIGLIPTIPWLVAGWWLVPFIFGANWRGAGYYVEILSISFLAQFVAVPISQVLIYLNRQGVVLIWDIARILLTVASLGLPRVFAVSDLVAVGAYSLIMIVGYWALYLLGLWALKAALQPREVPLEPEGSPLPILRPEN